MHWTPPSNNQINSNTNPFRALTTEQVRQNMYKQWAKSIEENKKPTNELSELSVPETHQLNIARKTVKMNPVMAKVMGGMSIEQAHEFLSKHGTAAEKKAAKDYLDRNGHVREQVVR